MKKSLLSLCLFGLLAGCGTPSRDIVRENFDFAAGQFPMLLAATDSVLASAEMQAEKPKFMPRSLELGGAVRFTSARDWTSGFLPGSLWYMYEYTGEAVWREQAWRLTQLLEAQQFNTGTHDLGFMINDSYGNAWRLTGDTVARNVVVQTARTLVKRFNPTVGCIQSWNPRNGWIFPVIIDNMMNLELLFSAAQITGDTSLYDIAVAHANTTMANHFRTDHSSWHVVDYDPETGAIRAKNTHQGFADESSWARGQAWGLYGFAMCYRWTGDERYLQHAERIAERIFSFPTMPEDLVPYWDFNAPGIPDEPRDVSAAAVIVSALYELSTFGTPAAELYLQRADKIIESLSTLYRLEPGAGHGFLLTGSTGNKPSGDEISTTLNYADYYFLEALLRKDKLNHNK